MSSVDSRDVCWRALEQVGSQHQWYGWLQALGKLSEGVGHRSPKGDISQVCEDPGEGWPLTLFFIWRLL